MLSKVQGFTFKENKNWVEGGDEGPEWVADAPLTKEQKREVGLGDLRRVKPDKCEASASLFGYGWTTAWATGNYFKAVAYAKKANSLRGWRDNEVDTWGTTAFVMPEGVPQAWTRNLAATVDECKKFTSISANGDIKKVNLTTTRKDIEVEWLESGAAVSYRDTLKSGSRRGVTHYLWEPIGNVLYGTSLNIWSDDAKQWARASALYNRLADSVAKAQGVEREPVDLREGTPLVPNPAEYAPPPGPSNSQA
jgi:hypothetical protein